jgi:hypothetical protein
MMGVHEELTADERRLGDMLRSSFAELSLTPDQKQRHRLRLVQSSNGNRSTSINANGVAGAGRMSDITSKPTRAAASAAGKAHPRFARALEGAALLVIVLLVGAGALLAYALIPGRGSLTSSLAEAPRVSTVYAFQQLSTEAKLLPLDPTTLADLSGSPITPPPGYWAVSPDGSTVVSFEFPQGTAMIVVKDGFTGPERTRFASPVQGTVGTIELNRDGSRILVNRRLQPSQWFVIDGTTGKLLTSLDTKSPNLASDTPMTSEDLRLNPDGTRLYRFVFADRSDASGPQPLRVIEYDSMTGDQLATMTYDSIRVGSWQTTQPSGSESVSNFLQPGIAFAPDGREIAIVHPDGEAVTLINANNLTVERTITPSRPTSFLERAVRRLGIVPQSAAAKTMGGAIRSATYAADGTALYTWGDTITVDSTNGMHGVGFTRIDLKSGATTQVLTGALIQQVQPSPDGTSLYVTGYVPTAGTSSPPNYLRRLDPASLQTLAERSLTDVYEIELVTQRQEK